MNKYIEKLKLNTDKLKEIEKQLELKKHKVKLALTDDAKRLVKEGKDLQKVMQKAYKPFPKLEADYGKIYDRILDFIDEAKDLPKRAKSIQKETTALYKKLEKSAKELGIDVTDIKVANDLDEIGVNLEDDITLLENALRDANQV